MSAIGHSGATGTTGFLFLLTIERSDRFFLSTTERNDGVAANTSERGEMLQGMLDMLILKALSLAPMHGWGITERIRQWSEHVLQVNQGALYPALYRLKRQGMITSSWKTTENNRKARYYALTTAGRRSLHAEHERWRRVARGVDLVMTLSKI